jgi:DNA replication protein DnaC
MTADEIYAEAVAMFDRAQPAHEIRRWVPDQLGTAEFTEEQREELREREAEQRSKIEDAAWVRSRAVEHGVPPRLAGADMLQGQRTLALEAAITYFNEGLPAGRCLVLVGPTGVGKTYAAAALMRAVRHGHFWYFPGLCGAWLDQDRRQESLALARTVRFAVFDDFGVEYAKNGGLVEAFLDEMIWHREANRLATVITTNLTTEQLRARLSDRIVDRLRGDWGRVYECPGESLRNGRP